MRQIKFRYWDEDGKMYYQPFTLYLSDKHEPMVVDKEGKTFGHNGDAIFLMQFTGLKDKNGKEIYEGDVLRGMGTVGRWLNYRVEIPQFYYDISDGASDPECCKIIGNIHENPELLK